ncbi:MAG: TolC family protein, partial [Muribaculaceae bacterium]|nr:TolC family protein [Muribaculaceae bacterium]
MRTLNLILKISAVILLFSFGKSEGQLRLTLDEAILCARTNSVDAAVALDELRTGYWEYRTYRAELLPELTLTGTVPSYHKQYSTYMNAEGNYSFVANNYFEINGGLSLSQRIWPTGGTLSVNTSADWLRQLSGDSYNRYMSIPVALTLQQPVFGVNTIRWDRRIEPVRYSEAKAAFLSATEDVAIQVTGLYFTLLMARENRDIARQNLSNAEKLYEVAVEKRNMGQISRNDLLQMELNVLNAQSELTERDSDLRSAMFQLCAFLDID